MSVKATSETTAAQAQPEACGGLHDAFWTRSMIAWMGVLPRWLCVLLASPIVFVIYLLAGCKRRAVCGNLEALRPEDGPLLHWWGGFRVFRQFALTYMDRLWFLHFNQEVSWEAKGDEYMERLSQEPGGALIFTIHAGNYDIGSALFASKLGRELHTVRSPEQTASLQRLRAKEFAGQGELHPLLHIHYNESYAHLGLTLCNLLNSGKLVGIQGDRVVMDVSPMNARLGPLQFRLPRGPLVLAETTRVPCYPIFLRRKGIMSYHVDIGAPFALAGEVIPVDELAGRWLKVMHGFLSEHWDQWFVFEHLVTRIT